MGSGTADAARPTVCVLGLGYVGLPTASLLATKGFRVLGVDVNEHVVQTVNEGRIHITEPDLDVLVRSAVLSGNLVAATKPRPSDVFILAVPTPFREGHEADITYVENAARSIAPHVRAGNLVILESTSPVGTTERVAEILADLRKDVTVARRGAESAAEDAVFVAHCPERVLPGRVLKELVENDRVIGGIDLPSSERARRFYASFVAGKVLVTDARTAELCKLAENAFRDVNIAFANELSVLCERLDIDVWRLIELANHHPRVKILQPGPGVGGHCVAVDPWFLVSAFPEETPLMAAARHVNDAQPHRVVARVRRAAQHETAPRIACLGLSYKADIDDVRESPAVEIVRELATSKLGPVVVSDPHVAKLPPTLQALDGVKLLPAKDAVADSNIVVLLVNHRAFRSIGVQDLAGKTVIDTRGFWR